MPLAHVRGIDIYWERRGTGEKLLFINGSGGDLRNRPSMMDPPATDVLDVLGYDQRGLGQSGKPDAPYTMADYADDAAGLMDALGWPRAKVVGVSFGGMVAQEFVLRHPQKVSRLVLACTSPGGAGGPSYPLHTLAHMERPARARFMVGISDTRCDEAWQAANPELYEQAVGLTAVDPYAGEPGRAMGARRQLEARAGHDVWDRLGEIACPVLIAAGRYDGIAPPANQEAMASRIPNAELRYFEGGHGFLMQDPAARPAMIEFLRRPD